MTEKKNNFERKLSNVDELAAELDAWGYHYIKWYMNTKDHNNNRHPTFKKKSAFMYDLAEKVRDMTK